MLEFLELFCQRPWSGVYLRVIAVVMAYGAVVHGANLLGFGERPWSEMPLAWRLGDIGYLVADTAVAVGLWRREPWGVVLLLAVIASQFVIYTVFVDRFAFTDEHRRAIRGLLWTEGAIVAGLVALAALRK